MVDTEILSAQLWGVLSVNCLQCQLLFQSVSAAKISFIQSYTFLRASLGDWPFGLHAGHCKGQSLLLSPCQCRVGCQTWLAVTISSTPSHVISPCLTHDDAPQKVFRPKLCFPLASGGPNQWQFLLGMVSQNTQQDHCPAGQEDPSLVVDGAQTATGTRKWSNSENSSGGRECIQMNWVFHI